MEIKQSRLIVLELNDIDFTDKHPQYHNKKWVALDDLKSRIETICNHGNERDVRFRDLLFADLEV